MKKVSDDYYDCQLCAGCHPIGKPCPYNHALPLHNRLAERLATMRYVVEHDPDKRPQCTINIMTKEGESIGAGATFEQAADQAFRFYDARHRPPQRPKQPETKCLHLKSHHAYGVKLCTDCGAKLDADDAEIQPKVNPLTSVPDPEPCRHLGLMRDDGVNLSCVSCGYVVGPTVGKLFQMPPVIDPQAPFNLRLMQAMKSPEVITALVKVILDDPACVRIMRERLM